jgi:hypothetical protein
MLIRKLQTRSARMVRFLEMATQPKPTFVPWVISAEATLIREALEAIEDRWGDRETAANLEGARFCDNLDCEFTTKDTALTVCPECSAAIG